MESQCKLIQELTHVVLSKITGSSCMDHWINDKLERNIPNQGTTEIGKGLGQPRNQELQVGSS